MTTVKRVIAILILMMLTLSGCSGIRRVSTYPFSLDGETVNICVTKGAYHLVRKEKDSFFVKHETETLANGMIIDTISDKTFTVVCYVNPRTAMFYLDEAFGADNWSKRITVDKKSQDSPVFAICTIEAKLEDGSTVTREDVGESKDSPKSAVSDSIKRTAMNFFPALRALYTIPPLRIYPSDLGLGKIEGKEKIKDVIRYKKFFVESITFGEGETGTFVKALQIGEEDAEAVVCKYESKRKSLSKGDTESVLQLKQMLM